MRRETLTTAKKKKKKKKWLREALMSALGLLSSVKLHYA